MSNFTFLNPEFPHLHDHALAVEKQVMADPRSACFRARHALEMAVHWLYEHDRTLRTPYDTKLDALLHEPSFRTMVPVKMHSKMMAVKRVGNQAAHSRRPITQYDALCACRELFHIMFWLARTYTRTGTALVAEFDQRLIPKPVSTGQAKTSSVETLRQQETAFRDQLKSKEDALKQREESMALQIRTLEDREAALAEVNAELAKTRAELAEAKQRNEALPDSHDYSEAETRKFIIDLLLKEAGWEQGKDWSDEYPVTGMPNVHEEGKVDYVLWGDDGLPLAVVEAKRTSKDPHVGQQQAKLYADCLTEMKGRRPIIFYTNGYETWLWDDTNYPPRMVQGFYNKAELELLIQRRTLRNPLKGQKVSEAIAGRYYQKRAIAYLCEGFKQKQRKGLLAMATGTGKTRTAIALVDVLMRCNWVKRVLFLADRVALVRQAVNAFKAHLPDSSPVNLVTEKDGQGRVFVSTYPTMMGLIEELEDGRRKYGVGHFDLVIIDEAHRSVYQKYGAIFQYFDSLLVGLTATPRDELHHDTYHLFDLETGVPTDAYSLEKAVDDEFLVPPRAISVPLKFQREGIKYDDLSEEEQEHWESLDWSDHSEVGAPDKVTPNAVNKWLFNEDTVDKVLKHLIENGQKVEGGDKLAKTIVFAKNHQHALFIQKRFDIHYPHLKGAFSRVIDNYATYAQSLIDDFSDAAKLPQIAISVDMLDTGIDIPEVANLIFFKIVRSRTKFHQMIGRGTRLCPDLFGPGRDKSSFTVFDYCGNLEYFNENPEGVDGGTTEALGTRLFRRRLELLDLLQKSEEDKDASQIAAEDTHLYGNDAVTTLGQLATATADILHTEVAAMNLDNFIVRPKRRFVERFQERDTWSHLDTDKLGELHAHVAGLLSEQEAEEINAKLFDLTCLKLQLAIIDSDPAFARLQKQVWDIAADLGEKESIPMVKAQMPLILEVQTDEYWEGVTLPLLEMLRLKLRDLVQFVDRKKREPVYTVLTDDLGEGQEIELGEFRAGVNLAQYRKKVEQYIRANENHITIHKLKHNIPLTKSDLSELERFLFETGEAQSRELLEEAFGKQESLTLFIRSLVGLDRSAAMQAFSKYLDKNQFNTSQIRFVELIIDHLTQKGVMDPGLLYEQPFTGIHFEGLDGVFPGAAADEIVEILRMVEGTAKAG